MKKKKELNASTTKIYSGGAFTNPKRTTEVVRRLWKNAVGFSGKKIIEIKIKEDTQEKENDREFFGNIAKLFSK